MATKRSIVAIEAMEAKSVDVIPRGPGWQYEPKWDGFRCLLFRNGTDVKLQSKSGRDLTRYFPEIAKAAITLEEKRFAIDGEIVIPEGSAFSFDSLLQRVHPAASRISKLSKETPAIMLVFDILQLSKQPRLLAAPLSRRRPLLETFAKCEFTHNETFRLSPTSKDPEEAGRWLRAAGGGYDGVIAKRLDLSYQSGSREGMQKIKRHRSADCVVGGFRYAASKLKGRNVVGSILLGLYDDKGALHHVGFTSGIKAAEKVSLTERLLPLRTEKSFSGKTPGGPSRWSTKRSSEWQAVRPKLVVEVSYDHFTGDRFRHGTRLLRWRPDKRPDQCNMDQLYQKLISPSLLLGS